MNETNRNINKSPVLDLIAKLVLISLSFLVPIFFLPTTLEFFNFNKLALITIATLLMVVYWAVKILLGQKIGFTKSMLDLPLLAFLLVASLATFFSISKIDSVWGSQGRWTGLITMLIFASYFFLTTPLLRDIKTVKAAVYALLASTTLSSLVSVLSYFKIYFIGADFSKIPNFNFTGTITDTVFLAAIGVILAFGLIAFENLKPAKIAIVATIFVNYLYIALTGLLLGYVVLGAGIIGLLTYVEVSRVSKEKVFYSIAALLVVALTLFTIIPTTRNVLINKNFPKEPSLSIKDSWMVASSIIQNYPLLATGPGTFYLNFTKYRPLNLNNDVNWTVRFDTPKNEYFNVMATLGLLGIIVGLFVISKLLKFVNSAKTTQDESGVTKVLSAAVLAMLVGYFFTFATVVNIFLMVAMLGILVATHALVGSGKLSESIFMEADALSSLAGTTEASVIKKEYFRYIVSIPMFLLATYVGYLEFKNYAGEYFMRQSILSAAKNDGKGTYDAQRLAIIYNPDRDIYQTSYAQTNLSIANTIASQQNLTETDKQTVQALIAQSIRSVRIATEVSGPLNAANWESRAIIYRSLINVAQNASDWTVSAYNTAIQLDPSNPRLRVDLGGIYYQTGDYLSAANQFRQATLLKGDYANAYFNFANALVMLKDFNNARAALETTRNLVPQNSDDAKMVDGLITQLINQAQVAGAATAKPTVEQIAGNQNTGQNAKQEPLTNAATAKPTVNTNVDLGKLPQAGQNAQPGTQPKQ